MIDARVILFSLVISFLLQCTRVLARLSHRRNVTRLATKKTSLSRKLWDKVRDIERIRCDNIGSGVGRFFLIEELFLFLSNISRFHMISGSLSTPVPLARGLTDPLSIFRPSQMHTMFRAFVPLPLSFFVYFRSWTIRPFLFIQIHIQCLSKELKILHNLPLFIIRLCLMSRDFHTRIALFGDLSPILSSEKIILIIDPILCIGKYHIV